MRRTGILMIVFALLLAAPAAAQIPPIPTVVPTAVPTIPPIGETPPEPGAYQANDGRGFRDILPSGTRGLYNAVDLAAFLATGRTQPHCCEQLGMYGNLVYATPGLQGGDLGKYFKDSSFGVPAGQVERRYSPRGDVTIVRDKGFGVPHVYGRDRDGAMFGLGYAAAEDRLFFMDALRNAGRGKLSSFAGGANAAQDRDQWEVAPYTEADLERQTKPPPGFPADLAATIASDADNYIAGINRYITEAKLDPTKMPGEYAALGHPQGPEPWRRADLVAAASLVGGIFGRGGGNEIAWTEVKHALDARFKKLKRAKGVFKDFRAAEDPEAPTTIFRSGKRFTYQAPPKKLAKGSRAIYRRGSLQPHQVVASKSGAQASAASKGVLDGLLAFPKAASNAMLVSARESADGKPLMVAGPQVAYFNPQILMEQDVHAPAAPGKPGIDARGASFIGLNLYVQLGRGRDYAWSATSAGQDNIDTYAVPTCLDDMHYVFRGRCEPVEVLDRVNSWQPSAGRQHARRHGDAAGAAHQARHRRRARDRRRQAGAADPPALDLLPRDRLGRRLHALQRPGADPQRPRLPARRQRHRLHVQLVLFGREADRLLQLGRQPAAPEGPRPQLPGLGQAAVRVAGLRSRPEHLEADAVLPAPPGGRPEVPGVVEQQAGQGLPRRRLQHVLLRLPLAAARGPAEAADQGQAQGDAGGAWSTRWSWRA